MNNSNYHRILRVAMVVCAIALVFESGLIDDSTAQISQGTHAYLANAVGMSAAVQPTELNQFTAKLTAKEQELAAREAALKEREISIALGDGSGNNSTATYVLASVLFILLVLILLNYVLDYIRVREEQELRPV